jgi:hypothetical protein
MDRKTMVAIAAGLGLAGAAFLLWQSAGSRFLFHETSSYEFEVRYLWLSLATIQFAMVLGFGVAIGGIAIALRNASGGELLSRIAGSLVGLIICLAGLGIGWAALHSTGRFIDAMHTSLALVAPQSSFPTMIAPSPDKMGPVMAPEVPAK